MLNPIDIFKPRMVDDKVIAKFKSMFPDSAERVFQHVKVFDSTTHSYFDGVYFYEWACFCKSCESCRKSGFEHPSLKCKYLVIKKKPYSFLL
jgi:hypothetical protein